MTIRYDDAYYPTEALITSQPRKRYCAPVHTEHWQLRSMLGFQAPNLLFYPACLFHVRCLDTKTLESRIVMRLPFEARCLVARNGWICCGGENADFVAFRHDASDDSHDRRAWDLDIDMDRCLELLEAYERSERSNPASQLLKARSQTVGKERINCITVWDPPTLVKPVTHAYRSTVAVLSNNDKTVSIFRLEATMGLDHTHLDTVICPDCVNRAVISPDGRLMATICDDPYLYLYEYALKPNEADDNGDECKGAAKAASKPRWTLCDKIALKSQSITDKTDNRGSFALCFSNTGKYLAVGTQYGYISVFLVSNLPDHKEEALLYTFTSTRPNAPQGAIRDMAWAPGPIDLLAWTESYGRVGVADLRSGFVSRQIVHLDKDTDFEHLAVRDRNNLDPRLLEPQSERNDGPGSADSHYSRLFGDLRRDMDRGRYYLEGLSAEDRRVLDALSTNSAPTDLDNSRRALDAVDSNWRRLHQQRVAAEARALRNEWTGTRPVLVSNGARRDNPLAWFRDRTGGARDSLFTDHGTLVPESPEQRQEQDRLRLQRLRNERQRFERQRSAEQQLLLREERFIQEHRLRLEQLEEENRLFARQSNAFLRERTASRERTTSRVQNGSRATRAEELEDPSSRVRAGVETQATDDMASMDAVRHRVEQLLAMGSTQGDTDPALGSRRNADGGTSLESPAQIGIDEPQYQALPPGPRREPSRWTLAGLLQEAYPLPSADDDSPVSRLFSGRGTKSELLDTSGLAWSEDGRILYIAAEIGIYEFHVNMLGRKLLPSLTLR